MAKQEISKNTFIYPMPMVIVGTKVAGRSNFLSVGWVNRVNSNPPMLSIAVSRRHYSTKGLIECMEFSVNVPDEEMIAETDYCGMVSGAKVDKSGMFDEFYGSLKNAPMISQCPLTMECKVVQVCELPTNNIYIAEIVGAYGEERVLDEGKPDVMKLRPFVLTMPDNKYWSMGENVGQAWSVGSKFA